MTKTEAIREVNTVSSGTLGRLIGTTRYDDIDRFLTKLTQAIEGGKNRYKHMQTLGRNIRSIPKAEGFGRK